MLIDPCTPLLHVTACRAGLCPLACRLEAKRRRRLRIAFTEVGTTCVIALMLLVQGSSPHIAVKRDDRGHPDKPKKVYKDVGCTQQTSSLKHEWTTQANTINSAARELWQPSLTLSTLPTRLRNPGKWEQASHDS